jgi:HSP20 family protein
MCYNFILGGIKMKWPAKRTVSEPTRWDPFEEIRRTQERLSQLFEDFMPMKEWGGGKVFTPAVDIKEEENKLVVTTDLPGINKEDIEINLKEDMLEISAKSGKEKETEEEGYIRRERSYTHFYRAVRLPTSVKEEGSTAKIENGVLTITASENETGRASKENTDRIIFREQKDSFQCNRRGYI